MPVFIPEVMDPGCGPGLSDSRACVRYCSPPLSWAKGIQKGLFGLPFNHWGRNMLRKSDLKKIVTDKSHLTQLLPYRPEWSTSVPSTVENIHINPLARITNKNQSLISESH